jgi:hypothetical protein
MALEKGMRFIRSDKQSWKIDIALIAIVSAPLIQDHIGHDGEHGGLPVPKGIEDQCDTMEIWGSEIDPFTNQRGDLVIWELVFKRGTQVVAEVSRPDPETPDQKAAREKAELEAAAAEDAAEVTSRQSALAEPEE